MTSVTSIWKNWLHKSLTVKTQNHALLLEQWLLSQIADDQTSKTVCNIQRIASAIQQLFLGPAISVTELASTACLSKKQFERLFNEPGRCESQGICKNSPFPEIIETATVLIWGKYKRRLWKRTLTVSFQFHHTQMDGAHASRLFGKSAKRNQELGGIIKNKCYICNANKNIVVQPI